jgi:glycosyltransferase involved in cell wall biosynthesis
MTRIFLHANFDTITGYGNTATQFAIQLKRKGVEVYPMCKGIGLEMPMEFLELLNQKHPILKYIDYYVNMDLPSSCLIPGNFMFIEKKILYTMWEQTKLSKGIKRKHFKDYDFLCVPCPMNKDVFSAVKDESKIIVNPLGVETDFYLPFNRDFYTGPLKVCMNGALTYRKGIDILTDVMLDERIKNTNIEFHLKNSQRTVHPKICEANPNIYLYEGVWDKEQIRSFYYKNHVMICPNRGEGYNQPAVEFICTGGVVITHKWGAHDIWADKLYCEVLPHKMINVDKTMWKNANDNSQWAEVDKEDIINSLLKINKNRSELMQKSHIAIGMSKFFGFDKMARDFIVNLEEIKC